MAATKRRRTGDPSGIFEKVFSAVLSAWPVSDLASAASTSVGAYAAALEHPLGILPLGGRRGNRLHRAIITREYARLEELLGLHQGTPDSSRKPAIMKALKSRTEGTHYTPGLLALAVHDERAIRALFAA